MSEAEQTPTRAERFAREWTLYRPAFKSADGKITTVGEWQVGPPELFIDHESYEVVRVVELGEK